MINLSPELVGLVMLGLVVVGVILGFPLAFVIGGVTITMGILLFGPKTASWILYSRTWEIVTNYTLLAVPGFIFIVWLGGLRGGLAITTVVLGTILAATVGIIGASVSALAIIALPAMIKRGYDKALAGGAVCAGGTLGILIPPSVMLVVYGPMALISVGKLFFAAFLPGFLLSALYIGYITVYSFMRPKMAPAVDPQERAAPLLKKTTDLFLSMLPPLFLILAVLGSIFAGIATPTEAAGVGAVAATLLAVIYRHFNWRVLQNVVLQTVILSAPGGKWGIFAIVMFVVFLLGYFIDWLGILFIVVPIITPVGKELGFDPLWFAMMICVNLQTSFMTPPFAYAIFYLRGAADPALGLTTAHIIRGVIPYVILILVALLLVIFPQIILWLPGQMIKPF
jgi:TRAP-type mannitol/chloroaromatic compound transport system permease large subunit